jgi:hypothetical protein
LSIISNKYGVGVLSVRCYGLGVVSLLVMRSLKVVAEVAYAEPFEETDKERRFSSPRM